MSRRIVVADNDIDALDLVSTDLTLEGHEVVGRAMQGDEAIELCRTLRPDVLVVDFRMPPGPNGVDVTRELRDLEDLHIVVYTNYRDARIRSAVQGMGATYLVKGELPALRAAVSLTEK